MPIRKPDSCRECPFYSLSEYITPDALVNSEIIILAQAPGEHEEQGAALTYKSGKYEKTEPVRPQPLIGSTGNLLKREFWPRTGIPYAQASRANVIKCRPHNSNELPSLESNKPVNGITIPMLREAVAHCTRVHLEIPPNTKYILAMGSLALYATTRKRNLPITDWRGWVLGRDLGSDDVIGLQDYYTPMAGSTLYTRLVDVFPVVHLASLYQSQRYYNATLHDFTRFGKLVRGEWPLALPQIKVNELPKSILSTIGFDTEYDPDQNNKLEMWSMADVEGNVYVVDAEYSRVLQNVPEKLTLVTQNGLVDIPHFKPLIEDLTHTNILIQDCMLAHAVLNTGEPNSLDYMLSKYGFYNRHKHLRTTHDLALKHFYAGLDADTTLNHAWYGLLREFTQDKHSWQEYIKRRQPLLKVIDNFNAKGVAVWEDRVSFIADLLDTEVQEIEAKAKALTGNENFNIASNAQVSAAIYGGTVKSPKRKKK